MEESLERLGLDRLQLVYLHDPEKITFEEGTAAGGPLEALIDLRDQGVIGHLGVAGGPIDLELKYLATDVFDVVISHNRYTLVDQTRRAPHPGRDGAWGGVRQRCPVRRRDAG